MSTINQHTLQNLVTEALERTAMVLADPSDAGDDPAFDRYAVLHYSGYVEGDVFLAASNGFVQEMAASLLGVDESEVAPDGLGQEALNELANIVGGSVTLALGGDANHIKLHLPETAGACDLPRDLAAAVVCDVDSMGEPLRVIWAPKQASAQAA